MHNAGIGDWPARRARMSPGRTALVFDERAVTYAEFATRVAKLAARLQAAGVSTGDRVAYLGPNHPSFVETMFATALAGGIFVPLNFRLTAPEVRHLLTDSGAKVLFRAPTCVEVAEGGCEVIGVEDGYEEWLAEGGESPMEVDVSADDVALILYTSGTTGKPKGAILSHANLIWNTYNLLVGVDVAGDEVTLISAPLFHIAALAQTLLPTFLKGGCALIMASWDVDACYGLVERYRVTWMFGVTTMYASLSQSPKWSTADLSSLRSLMCGGAAVPASLIRTYQDRGLVFCQGYGMTETAPGVTFLEAGESVRHVGSAGVPVFFTEVRLDAGEVVVKGPNVTPGYWNNPAATAAAFDDDGWFHTGDVATVDGDGHLHIVDRLKDMFISGGENVYPAEVENALFAHPAVTEVAVIGVPDEKWGEVGRAFLVCAEGPVAAADLREFLLERLAKYKIPVYFDVVEQLPRTGSGKVRKTALRELQAGG